MHSIAALKWLWARSLFCCLQKNLKATAESDRSRGSRKQVKERGRWKRIQKLKGMCFGGGGSLSSLAIKADKKQNPDSSLLAQPSDTSAWPGNSVGASPCPCCCSWGLTPSWESFLVLHCLGACWRQMLFGNWLSPDNMLLRSLHSPRESRVNRGPKWDTATGNFRKKKEKHSQSRSVKFKVGWNGREKLDISYKVLKGTAWLFCQFSLYP